MEVLKKYTVLIAKTVQPRTLMKLLKDKQKQPFNHAICYHNPNVVFNTDFEVTFFENLIKDADMLTTAQVFQIINQHYPTMAEKIPELSTGQRFMYYIDTNMIVEVKVHDTIPFIEISRHMVNIYCFISEFILLHNQLCMKC